MLAEQLRVRVIRWAQTGWLAVHGTSQDQCHYSQRCLDQELTCWHQ